MCYQRRSPGAQHHLHLPASRSLHQFNCEDIDWEGLEGILCHKIMIWPWFMRCYISRRIKTNKLQCAIPYASQISHLLYNYTHPLRIYWSFSQLNICLISNIKHQTNFVSVLNLYIFIQSNLRMKTIETIKTNKRAIMGYMWPVLILTAILI